RPRDAVARGVDAESLRGGSPLAVARARAVGPCPFDDEPAELARFPEVDRESMRSGDRGALPARRRVAVEDRFGRVSRRGARRSDDGSAAVAAVLEPQ